MKSAGGRERTASLLSLEATVCVVMVTAERRRSEDREEDREGKRGGGGGVLVSVSWGRSVSCSLCEPPSGSTPRRRSVRSSHLPAVSLNLLIY